MNARNALWWDRKKKARSRQNLRPSPSGGNVGSQDRVFALSPYPRSLYRRSRDPIYKKSRYFLTLKTDIVPMVRSTKNESAVSTRARVLGCVPGQKDNRIGGSACSN